MSWNENFEKLVWSIINFYFQIERVVQKNRKIWKNVEFLDVEIVFWIEDGIRLWMVILIWEVLINGILAWRVKMENLISKLNGMEKWGPDLEKW